MIWFIRRDQSKTVAIKFRCIGEFKRACACITAFLSSLQIKKRDGIVIYGGLCYPNESKYSHLCLCKSIHLTIIIHRNFHIVWTICSIISHYSHYEFQTIYQNLMFPRNNGSEISLNLNILPQIFFNV